MTTPVTRVPDITERTSPLSISDWRSKAVHATASATRANDIRTKLEADLAAVRKDADAEVNAMPLSPADKRKFSDARYHTKAAELTKAATEQVDELMKLSGQWSAVLDEQADLLAPERFIFRKGLMDAGKFAQTSAAVASLGQKGLATMAELAADRNDPVLTAAVITALETLPANKRPYSIKSLAASVANADADYSDLANQVAAVGTAVASIQSSRKALAGRDDKTSKIRKGLADRDLERLNELEAELSE